MTIRKGETWGEIRVPPSGVALARSNTELHALVTAPQRPPVIGIYGGDMMRTLGGSTDRTRFAAGQPLPHLPIDIVRVVADDSRESLFVVHLVARRSWWRGRITLAMNAEFLGDWDVVPRGHPNDGKVDIVTVAADLSMSQRWMARSRVRLGTHVPHPSITIQQRPTATIEFDDATPLWLDGERWGSARKLELTVESDAIVVCV